MRLRNIFKGWSFFKKKTIVFGDFSATQYILFENKNVSSLLFFYFKGDGWQDRFHTHAFNAVSIKFFGTYEEGTLHYFGDRLSYQLKQSIRTEVFRYFPRDSYHMLGKSKGCLTMLISGPWKPTWKEFLWKEGVERELGWGRAEQ